MPKRKDDFSTDVIRRLRERVAHRCSNPECRAVTVGAATNQMGVNSVGEAAHIRGASPGAARYKASMTSGGRKAIDNGIWLCTVCHTKVDNDESRYPVELLDAWKAKAEEFARSEIGKRLWSNDECQDMLVARLTGVPGHLSRAALANVIESSGRELHRLDSRFRVMTSYANAIFTHAIHAIEDVRLSFKVASEGGTDAVDQIRRMLDRGAPVTLPAGSVLVDGSPLITHILELTVAGEGTITFTPRQVQATLKLSVAEPHSQQVSAFDDMHGTIQVGRKSMDFSGSNCGGLLHISFRKELETDAALTDGAFTADLSQWNGEDVRRLPYHEKVAGLFGRLVAGWQLEFALEVEGRELLRGRFNDLEALYPYVSAVDVMLRYSMRVGALAKHLDLRIDFQDNSTFTQAEHQAVADALDIFDGRRTYERGGLTSNVKCRLVMGEDASVKLLQNSIPMAVMIRSDTNKSVKLFNQTVVLPALEILLQAVVAKVISQTRTSGGKLKLRVEFVPADGFRCTFSYAKNNSRRTPGADLAEPLRIPLS